MMPNTVIYLSEGGSVDDAAAADAGGEAERGVQEAVVSMAQWLWQIIHLITNEEHKKMVLQNNVHFFQY